MGESTVTTPCADMIMCVCSIYTVPEERVFDSWFQRPQAT